MSLLICHPNDIYVVVVVVVVVTTLMIIMIMITIISRIFYVKGSGAGEI